MANTIITKERPGIRAFLLGALNHIDFDSVTVAASQANTAVQAFLVIPFACKVPLVSVAASSAASGITAMNIVVGGAAEAGALVADNSDVQVPPTTNSTAGLSLFQNAGNTAPQDQTVNLASAYTGYNFVTSVPDAIFPKGTVFTLRLVTGASVAGTVKVGLGMVPYDLYPYKPDHTVFSWSTDVG